MKSVNDDDDLNRSMSFCAISVKIDKKCFQKQWTKKKIGKFTCSSTRFRRNWKSRIFFSLEARGIGATATIVKNWFHVVNVHCEHSLCSATSRGMCVSMSLPAFYCDWSRSETMEWDSFISIINSHKSKFQKIYLHWQNSQTHTAQCEVCPILLFLFFPLSSFFFRRIKAIDDTFAVRWNASHHETKFKGARCAYTMPFYWPTTFNISNIFWFISDDDLAAAAVMFEMQRHETHQIEKGETILKWKTPSRRVWTWNAREKMNHFTGAVVQCWRY